MVSRQHQDMPCSDIDRISLSASDSCRKRRCRDSPAAPLLLFLVESKERYENRADRKMLRTTRRPLRPASWQPVVNPQEARSRPLAVLHPIRRRSCLPRGLVKFIVSIEPLERFPQSILAAALTYIGDTL